jgi:hypothetical protein
LNVANDIFSSQYENDAWNNHGNPRLFGTTVNEAFVTWSELPYHCDGYERFYIRDFLS